MKFSNFYAYIVAFAMMVSPFTALADACSHSSYAYNGSNQKVECESCHQEIDDYNRVIIYTSSTEAVYAPYFTNTFGATYLSNTYQDGKGVIAFASPVTTIGRRSFYTKTRLTSLVIPTTVTSIGEEAFAECQRLSGDLFFPKGLKIIENNAFSNCPSTLNIILNSVPYAATYALNERSVSIELQDDSYLFLGSNNLPTISSAKYTCSGSNEWGIAMVPFKIGTVKDKVQLYSISSVSDSNSKSYLQVEKWVDPNTPFIYHKLNADPTLEFVMASNFGLPQNTTPKTDGNGLYATYASKTLSAGDGSTYYTVGDNAFDKVTTSATIPAMHGWFQKNEADASVMSYAFVSELYKMLYKSNNGVIAPRNPNFFGTGIALISNTCDYNGNGVWTFDAPVTSIPTTAFLNQTSLTGITIPNTVTTIGSRAFSGCTSLSSINLPEGLISIGESAFKNCSGLVCRLDMPSTLTSVGDYAFESCSKVTALTLNQGLKTIGQRAFTGLSNARNSLTIPSSVTTINTTAFASCGFTGSVTVPATVTTLGSWIFGSCTGLTSAVMERALTVQMFNGCSNLSSVTLASNETKVPYRVFYDCSKLSSITLPESVSSINEEAFKGCTSLSSISIPNSVETIYDNAFAGCKNLERVNFVSIPEVSSTAFSNISSIAKYHVTLSDDSYLYCSYDNGFPTSATAEYTRSMKALSQWGTAILPFPVRCYQSTQYQFYTMSTTQMVDRENSTGAMMFRKTDDAIPANTPFVYKKKVEKATWVTFTGLSFKAPSYELYSYNVGGWSLQGTYSQMTDVSGMYYMAADQIWLAEDPINIKPFRAFFFDCEMSEYYSGGLRLVIEDEEENTTSLLEMAADGSLHEVNNEAIVDLQGRKMSAPAKGRLNIVNGKIMMIK